MKSVIVEQAIVARWPSWNKWPDTEDRDYSDVLAERWPWRFVLEEQDIELLINCRFIPAYKCYLDAGITDKAAVVPAFPVIHNVTVPSEQVQNAQLQALRAAAKECTVLLWEHSYQCYPKVAEHLPELFKLRLLSFGDDAPSSSPVKTLPVAKNFTALMHSMFIYDFRSGEFVRDIYARHGLHKTYHISSCCSNGLSTEIERTGFSVQDKIDRIAQGEQLAAKFAYVGFSLGNVYRKNLLDKLNEREPAPSLPGATKLHGVGMRDGVIGVKDNSPAMGANLLPVYADTMFGANPQRSSLFNTRLVDLWLTGVAQLIFDPHKELQHYGILPDVHYIPFDGTFEGMEQQMLIYANDRPRLAQLLQSAYSKCQEFQEQTSWTGAYKQMYSDHLDLLR